MAWSRDADFQRSLAEVGPQLETDDPDVAINYMRTWVDLLVEAREQDEISETEGRARLQMLTAALAKYGVGRTEVHHFARIELRLESATDEATAQVPRES